jgi:hypothetical protein
MADFALWATACETGLWPARTFTRAYGANRKAAIEGMIDADPIAACVRELMSERSCWTGSAADLLRIGVERASQTADYTGWPKNPRALAGHLRRAQTFLRALGIEIAFSREGRAGNRVIRMRKSLGNTVSTVSAVSSVRDSGLERDLEQHSPGLASAVCDDNRRPHSRSTLEEPGTAAGDADGADANAAFCAMRVIGEPSLNASQRLKPFPSFPNAAEQDGSLSAD